MNTGSSPDPRDTFPTLKESAKEREGVEMMVSEKTCSRAAIRLSERNVIGMEGSESEGVTWHNLIHYD